jgi:hypothetical protein
MVTTSGVPASGSSAGPVRLGIVAGAIRYAQQQRDGPPGGQALARVIGVQRFEQQFSMGDGPFDLVSSGGPSRRLLTIWPLVMAAPLDAPR